MDRMLAAVFVVSCPLLLAGATFYASPAEGPSSANDCTTRATAGNIKAAIRKAVMSRDNSSEVVLLSGVYDCSSYGDSKYGSMTFAPTRSTFCFGNNASNGNLQFAVNIRSESGNPEDVVIAGGGPGASCSFLHLNVGTVTNTISGVTIRDFHSSGATVANASGGAIYHVNGKLFVSNCWFIANSASMTGGSAPNLGGGAIYTSAALKCRDCLFMSNRVENAVNACSGGAVASYSNQENELVNCRFVDNSLSGVAGTSMGGAVWQAYYPSGNPARTGTCTAYGCEFTRNVAKPNGLGGAVYNVVCCGSSFTNDFSTADGAAGCGERSAFHDCDFYGFTNTCFLVSGASAVERCRFAGCRRIGSEGVRFRNCLFDACEIRGTSVGEWTLFWKSELVNCTVVNTGGWYDRAAVSGGRLMTAVALDCNVVNCVFAGSSNLVSASGARGYDVGRSGPSAVCACTNSFYGTAPVSASYRPEFAGCSEIADPAALRFAGVGEDPYSVGRRSPLVGAGLPGAWTSADTDIRGNPRVRDGEVDVGCYQCWSSPPGFGMYAR